MIRFVEDSKSKAELRKQVRAVLKNLHPSRRVKESACVCTLLEQQPFWRQTRSILFFASTPDEVNLWPCLEAALASSKLVCLPRSLPDQDAYCAAQVRDLQNDIVPGRFGIREPVPHCPEVPLNRLDLILVPGLAFDRMGHRLGRGKGHYDRWLTARSGLICGVAFDEQLVDAVPVEPHDLIVDCILTPSRWIDVSPRRAVPD